MLPKLWSPAERRGSSLRFSVPDIGVALLLVVTTIAWSAIAGKDLNWDQLNYHVYDAYSLLHQRLERDFLAANGQTILNPVAYLPFYWMVTAGWHSLLIGSLLAAFHSLNLVLAYFIARTVVREQSSHARVVAALGSVLALLSPTFLMAAGTSFADVTTAVFVLASLLLILRGSPDAGTSLRALLLAGFLFGASGGLKLSNLVFAPAFAGMFFILHRSPSGMCRAFLGFGIGAGIGLIATHGYWSWLLWDAYGNSGIPTIGGLLGSPEIPPGPMLPQRFLPESLSEALSLPFRMLQLSAWVYVESMAPDLRLAATLLLLCAAIALRFFRRESSDGPSAAPPHSRTLHAFVAFYVLSLALWIATSANGRYGLVVSVLSGPALAVIVHVIWRNTTRSAMVLITLVLVQAFLLQSAQLKWTNGKWTETWYEISVPERLRHEPYLYISVGGNSYSFIAPFLARQSAFTNPIGQISFDFDRPGGPRLRALLDEHEGRVRVIARADEADGDEALRYWVRKADTAIARLGFAIDATDCLMISSDGTWQLGDATKLEDEDRVELRTCALRKVPYQRTAERTRVTKVAQEIAAWCPKLFRPSNPVLEEAPYGWYASFVSSDTVLHVKGTGFFLSQPRSTAEIYLGTLDFWERGERPDCTMIPKKLRKVYNLDLAT